MNTDTPDYDPHIAFNTLIEHLSASEFDLAQTLNHLQVMDQHIPYLGTLLNAHNVVCPTLQTARATEAFSSGQHYTGAHDFHLIPYLIALYVSLNPAPDRSLTGIHHPPSGTGFKESELYQILDALIHVGADLQITHEGDDTALHLAVRSHHHSLVSALMTRGASPHLTNWHHFSPAHLAVYLHQYDTVRLFLDLGISPDFQASSVYVAGSDTLLMTAIRGGDLAMLDLLCEHQASIHGIPQHTDLPPPLLFATQLRYADHAKQMEVLRSLLDHGAPVNNPTYKDGTALHEAVYQRRMDIVLLLLDRGADVHLLDRHGDSPLHIAAFRGLLELSALFLSQGCDPNALNFDGQSPLSLAQAHRHTETVDLLQLGYLSLQEHKLLSEMELPIHSTHPDAKPDSHTAPDSHTPVAPKRLVL